MENNHIGFRSNDPALTALNTMRAAVSPEYWEDISVRIERGMARVGEFLIHDNGTITKGTYKTTLTRAIIRLRMDEADFQSAHPALLATAEFDGFGALSFAGYKAQVYKDDGKFGFGVTSENGEPVLRMKYKTAKAAMKAAKAFIQSQL